MPEQDVTVNAYHPYPAFSWEFSTDGGEVWAGIEGYPAYVSGHDAKTVVINAIEGQEALLRCTVGPESAGVPVYGDAGTATTDAIPVTVGALTWVENLPLTGSETIQATPQASPIWAADVPVPEVTTDDPPATIADLKAYITNLVDVPNVTFKDAATKFGTITKIPAGGGEPVVYGGEGVGFGGEEIIFDAEDVYQWDAPAHDGTPYDLSGNVVADNFGAEATSPLMNAVVTQGWYYTFTMGVEEGGADGIGYLDATYGDVQPDRNCPWHPSAPIDLNYFHSVPTYTQLRLTTFGNNAVSGADIWISLDIPLTSWPNGLMIKLEGQSTYWKISWSRLTDPDENPNTELKDWWLDPANAGKTFRADIQYVDPADSFGDQAPYWLPLGSTPPLPTD